MYIRVSTYRPSAGSTGAPTEETVQRVLELPGCRGLYYLHGEGGTSLSLSLWEDKAALDGNRDAIDAIRAETAAEQHMEVLGVDEYEVLTQSLKP